MNLSQCKPVSISTTFLNQFSQVLQDEQLFIKWDHLVDFLNNSCFLNALVIHLLHFAIHNRVNVNGTCDCENSKPNIKINIHRSSHIYIYSPQKNKKIEQVISKHKKKDSPKRRWGASSPERPVSSGTRERRRWDFFFFFYERRRCWDEWKRERREWYWWLLSNQEEARGGPFVCQGFI